MFRPALAALAFISVSLSQIALCQTAPASRWIKHGQGNTYVAGSGSFNSPSNPAKAGQLITIFATGVGPVSFTDGVTSQPGLAISISQ